MSDFQLTDADKHSGLWVRLLEHFETKLAHARIANESTQLTEPATAALRGEMRLLKSLIGLGADRTIINDAGERVRLPFRMEK